jgi:hypothetical protein
MSAIDAGDPDHPPSVYLDQFAYIRLARAGLGRGLAEDADHHQRLMQQAIAGKLRFPLSAVHYLETWRQANPTRRHELAVEMIRLSRLNAIAPARIVWRAEIRIAVHKTFGGPRPIDPISVWGQGAAHAFGREPGTFWPTELPPGEDLRREVLLLAGAGASTGRFAAEERERHDQQQRFGETQTALAERISAWPTSVTERRQGIRLQTLTDFSADVVAALIGADVPPARLGSLGAEGLVQFLEAIPTLWVLTELRRVRFANPQQGFTPHDLYDLRALACALVYCDVVITDRAWCDVIRRTDLADRYHTTVINDVADFDHA